MHSSPYLTPQWNAPRHIRALCSTRHGHTAVVDNVAATEGARAVWLHQVHGTKVVSLDNHSHHIALNAEADGSCTDHLHTACVVRVADCLPILLCNTQGTWVAALHAGWRGLAGHQGIGVVEQARSAYRAANGVASDLIAWLGPCIGKTAFEVGDEVRLAFTAHQPETQPFFTPVIHAEKSAAKKWMADLAGLARWRLQAAGIPNHAIFGNDGSRAWCTVSNPDQFFSYRREKECGRMAAAIWINAAPIPVP